MMRRSQASRLRENERERCEEDMMEDRPRILVVEDDEGTRRTLTMILERKGFEVETAETGEEALRKANERFYNAGLLDIKLPDGTGVDLLKPLRERHPDMGMIMITGHASMETAAEALNDGAAAYITKPLDVDEVLAELRKILEKQRLLEQKRAAVRQLRRSEEQYRALFEGVPIGLYRTTPDGRILQANQALVDMLGYPDRKTLLEVDACELYVDVEDCKRHVALLERDGIVRGFETQFRRHDGSVIWVRDTAHVSREVGGKPVAYEGSLEDVTEWKRAHEAEARARAELERYATQLEWLANVQSALSQARGEEEILTAVAMVADVDEAPESMCLGYVETDEGGVPIALRPAAVWQDGLVVSDPETICLPQEAMDSPLLALCLDAPHEAVFMADVETDPRADEVLIEFADEAGFRSAMLMPLHSGRRWQGVVRFLWSDPRTFSEEERFYVTQLLEPVAAVVASRRAYLAQRESEARYRVLFNNASDGTFIYDPEGSLLAANDVACEQLGYRRDELLDMPIEDIDVAGHGMSVPRQIEALQERGHLVFQTIYQQRDGSEIPVEVSSRLIEYGEQRAILSAVRDISDRLEMEEQLERQARLAAVGQLAGGIAHDFRNFLTTIILYAGTLLRRPELDPEIKRALEVIDGEAQQASDLVQQILDFSGRSAMEKRSIDLVAMIEEAADILRQTIPESIRMKLEIEVGAAVVEADPTRVQQVLMNLALNARDAMPEGGDLEIALSGVDITPDEDPPVVGMEVGRWICLTVSDTGTGMTEEVKDRVFEPFFTTKELEKGTGLGLAQVYGIVQQHQGAIDVETEVGAGSSFYVYLPACEAGEVEEEREEVTALPQGEGEIIFLVEDQENLREAGREMLTGLNYRVVTAANGREALEMLEGIKVDVVVTDVVMPQMGGKALIGELAQRFPDVPVLAVTGYTMDQEIEGLREAGFAGVLHKPFDARALARAVRDALDAR